MAGLDPADKLGIFLRNYSISGPARPFFIPGSTSPERRVSLTASI